MLTSQSTSLGYTLYTLTKKHQSTWSRFVWKQTFLNYMASSSIWVGNCGSELPLFSHHHTLNSVIAALLCVTLGFYNARVTAE